MSCPRPLLTRCGAKAVGKHWEKTENGCNALTEPTQKNTHAQGERTGEREREREKEGGGAHARSPTTTRSTWLRIVRVLLTRLLKKGG